MNKVVICKNADGNVQSYFAVADEHPIEELANLVVPEGNPFLVVTSDDIPSVPYHNAIEPDFSKPTGISIGADKIRAKWAADKEAELEKVNAALAEKTAEIRAKHEAEIKEREEAAKAAAEAKAAQDSVEGA